MMISERLYNLGIPPEILVRYDEPHRFYHNRQHINSMVSMATKLNILTDELLLAIIFHDIVYDPKRNDNEEKSVELFYKYSNNEDVAKAILETKTHKPTTLLSNQLSSLDLDVIWNSYETFVDFEKNIFKEYQFVDYKKYKEERLKILSKLGTPNEKLNYVKYREPKIGVYAGSFAPFHKGHYNILQQAEQVFDKVIIAKGRNPQKNANNSVMSEILKYRQIEYYDGLLTDFIDNLGYNVTLIRGLRNSNDLDYELTQYRFLQDLKPNIKVVSFFCDKEYEHISSSAIKQLMRFDKHSKYLI